MSRKQRSTPWAKDIQELAAWTHSFLAESEEQRLADAETAADERCAFLDEVATRVDEVCDATRTWLDEVSAAREEQALDDTDARIRYCNAVFDWYDEFSADCRTRAVEAEKARRQAVRAEARARRRDALARREAVARTIAQHAADRANWWGLGDEAPAAPAAAPSRSRSTRSGRGGSTSSRRGDTSASAGSSSSRRSGRTRRGGRSRVERPQQLSGADVIRSLRSRVAA